MVARETGRYEEEGWRLRKDGSRFLAHVIIAALYDDGHLCGFSKITRDVTQKRRLEEERIERERQQVARVFLRDVLLSVTQGKLRFCATPDDLPPALPTVQEPLPFTSASLGEVRRRTWEAASGAGLSTERRQDLLATVSEGAMNAVVHALAACLRIGVSPSGTVQVWIVDTGGGIPMAQVPQAALERGFSTSGTLGHEFWLMLETCDRLWLLTGPDGTTVVLEQDADLSEPQWLRLVA